MKRFYLWLALLLAAIPAFGQSTTVSGTVTDAGSQTWNNGTYTFTFVPNPQYPTLPQYVWTGGALSTTITGTLSGSGTYSVSIPSNTAITPGQSQWKLTVCPQASSPCVAGGNFSISGSTQTLNATPPAILINLAVAAPPISVYATGEATGAVIGSQVYLLGTGLQVCSTVSGNSCSVWTSAGGSGTVTAVTGTTNQIDVATGTTTPVISLDPQIILSGATGGAKGTGTINAQNLFINGGAVAPLASPTFTGTPAGPTASPTTNTTQLATTAFVLANTGISGLTPGYLPTAATSTSLANSVCDYGVTTANTLTCTGSGGAAFSGAVSVASDGVHAGAVPMVGNTTAPAVPSNVAGWAGPNSASFTAYLLQLPAANPAGNLFQCATPSSAISACTFSNTLTSQLALPAGSSSLPSICSAGTPCSNLTGFYFVGNAIGITDSGTPQQVFNYNLTPEFTSDSGGVLDWTSSSSSPTAGVDTGISRDAAGIVAIGTGAAASEAGFLRSANTCHPTSAVTLTAGTPVTLCSWSLPASAKTWAWSCSGIYSLTGGTTPTLKIEMNANHTPGAMVGSASIESTLAGTSTQATVSSTSTGNVNILTGATNTQANAQFTTFGMITASATAGTFAITVDEGGTGSPTGTVNIGTVCTLN